MKSFLKLMPFLFLLILGGYFLSRFLKGQEGTNIANTSHEESFSQNNTKRITHSILKIDPSTIIIGEQESVILNKPIKILVDKQEQIYVLDQGDGDIKKFSKDGRYLSTIGHGRGEGPGEFQVAVDFGFDTNENLFIFNLGAQKIKVYSKNGESLEEFFLPVSGYRMGMTPETLYLSMETPDEHHTLMAIATNGNHLMDFGCPLSEDPVENIWLSGGEVEANTRGGIVFVLHYGGYFELYDKQGNLKSKSWTINSEGFPKVINNDKISRLDPEAKQTTFSASIDNQFVYLFSGKDENGITYLDVYSVEKGDYQFSIQVPDNVSRAFVVNQKVYTINSNGTICIFFL